MIILKTTNEKKQNIESYIRQYSHIPDVYLIFSGYGIITASKQLTISEKSDYLSLAALLANYRKLEENLCSPTLFYRQVKYNYRKFFFEADYKPTGFFCERVVFFTAITWDELSVLVAWFFISMVYHYDFDTEFSVAQATFFLREIIEKAPLKKESHANKEIKKYYLTTYIPKFFETFAYPLQYWTHGMAWIFAKIIWQCCTALYYNVEHLGYDNPNRFNYGQ